MTNCIVDMSQRRAARVAGILYLLLIVFGVFAQMFARSSLIVWGDATATANNIMASGSLLRIAFLSDILMITCFLLLPLALYQLLKPVNKNIASLMVIFVFVSIPVMLINMLYYSAPLLLLSGASYLTVFAADQLNALAMLHLDLYTSGVMIATIFHGIWLFPLGYLVYKSGYFPRILGVFLMLACFGFLIESIQYFLLPGYEVITYPAMVFEILGEFVFCGWLLVKGAKISEMKS